MEQVRNMLEARKNSLLQVKKEKEKRSRRGPAGALRICCHSGHAYYYHRKDPKDWNGIYIREKDIDLAKRLAQKDYDQKVLRAAENELKAIENYLASDPPVKAEQIFEKMHPERQKLIDPIEKPDQQLIQEWESVVFEKKGFREGDPEFYTVKGERVRSKSELIIADMLSREKIPYRYEAPLLLKGLGKVYPDFTILNVRLRKEILWEHLGMMDDSNYAENAIQKIAFYEQNGFFSGENLVLTFETRKNPISQKSIQTMIQRYFL